MPKRSIAQRDRFCVDEIEHVAARLKTPEIVRAFAERGKLPLLLDVDDLLSLEESKGDLKPLVEAVRVFLLHAAERLWQAEQETVNTDRERYEVVRDRRSMFLKALVEGDDEELGALLRQWGPIGHALDVAGLPLSRDGGA